MVDLRLCKGTNPHLKGRGRRKLLVADVFHLDGGVVGGGGDLLVKEGFHILALGL